VTKLCELGSDDDVTSLSWSQRGDILAVGTRAGVVQLWDVGKMQIIRKLDGHFARVGSLAWSSQYLASGSRDRFIFLRDRRTPQDHCGVLIRHTQEVCGLKWSPDELNLASGGNDNKLLIWNVRSSEPTVSFMGEHNAAVKAIAWSPHQPGLIASGGGTADRCIRFWNTLNGTPLNFVDTGSQVCNLMWSTSVDELVSTHGYSLNQIVVWNYPTMQPLVTLTGHLYRVIYLAMSPDGQTIVTGAGDETLRFWNIFPSSKPKGASRSVGLFHNFSSNIR
jgi:cell division cycle 20-like protein 1 (cofactor of APC complex)